MSRSWARLPSKLPGDFFTRRRREEFERDAARRVAIWKWVTTEDDFRELSRRMFEAGKRFATEREVRILELFTGSLPQVIRETSELVEGRVCGVNGKPVPVRA